MNKDIISGKGKKLQGKAKQDWGKLTSDDLEVAEGSRDYLAGRIQERYGITKNEARRQVEEFEKKV